jgi:hypothetical protein
MERIVDPAWAAIAPHGAPVGELAPRTRAERRMRSGLWPALISLRRLGAPAFGRPPCMPASGPAQSPGAQALLAAELASRDPHAPVPCAALALDAPYPNASANCRTRKCEAAGPPPWESLDRRTISLRASKNFGRPAPDTGGVTKRRRFSSRINAFERPKIEVERRM